ncbi:MAG TPA: molybdopterin cofactor-binding domain-containing protein [Burkholderiales bacterium]|nr:molybdopterin cofactor-binding domain-containing protein [Burkholderiales bacterium]
MSAPELPLSLRTNPRLDRWVRFGAAGKVTVFSGKVELGQGIVTAIAQIAADELGVEPEQLAIVAGDTTSAPDEWYTAGSQSIEVGGTSMRRVCAEVRSLFVEAAAAELEVAPADLEVRAGEFAVPGTDLKRSYWELAHKVSLARDYSGRPVLPRKSALPGLVGTSAPRRDLPAKLGGAAYVHDMTLPGMVFARVLRPPAYGARLVALDEAALRSAPGVVAVVRSGSFLALAAEREEQAVAALEIARRAARWDAPPMPGQTEIVPFLMGLPARSSTVYAKGSAASAGTQRFEATYSKPYLAHASLGPSCALAVAEGGRIRIWSHTQGPHMLRGQIAKALGLPDSAVEVMHRDGAGCYGHNGADDAALDAALVARACGRPVMLQWTREDELRWAPYGSAMAVKIAADVEPGGRIVDWKHELWSHTHVKRPGRGEGIELLAAWHMDPPVPVPPAADLPLPAGGGDRNAVPIYDFPHQEVVYHFLPEMPLRVSALRALGAFANVFAIESMLDEIAAGIGVDPLELRLRHLADERAREVLRAAAQAAGAKRDGTGRGIGFARYKNLSAYCAVVADVEIARQLRVRRVVAAVDAGLVVNPDGLRNQIEGGIVQAASWALKEQVRWTRDGVALHGWEDYPILGFDEVPDIEVVIVERRDAPSLGAGECAAGPTAAAIANALYDGLGVRARHLPLTPERVAAAMN